jgi:hypothetical protein
MELTTDAVEPKPGDAVVSRAPKTCTDGQLAADTRAGARRKREAAAAENISELVGLGMSTRG